MARQLPTWTIIIIMISCPIAIVLMMFVPWKKKQIKNEAINKSYSKTSDGILNFTLSSLVIFVAMFSLLL